ncbi:blastula protease 10-like [Pomacea canaliculata]|uniref:blastula protease 10-like n=1 Tax=Pomacea canaliculata TaxID=400727 RepID=UPI000D7313B3|nr:blastula protease 10-like [Pomacea canaliculata]
MTMRCVIVLCLLGAQLITHVVTSSIDEIIASSAETANEFTFFQPTNETLSVKVELDMLFTAQQWKKIQLLNKTGKGVNGRYKRKAIRLDEYRWKEGVILYKIANVFTDQEKSEIRSALEEWQKFTCVTFKMASESDVNYVSFDNGGGCYSYVGMIGGKQQLGLAKGCRVKGVIVHEVGHAVGFQHEQTRPDRDDYVEIIQSNIPPNLYYNFQKYEKEAVNVFDVPYDYESIMHYGPKAFSVTGGETIRTRDPTYQSVIGNRNGLSFLDIKLANLMYGCSRKASCGDIRCPGEGFVDKNCKCMCRGSPVRECYGTTLGTKSEVSTTAEKSSTTRSETGGCRDFYSSCSKWAERGDCA